MSDSNAPKTLCLIDGSGYIFRAFYALPPMTRADGTPVNAVYGFITMLMNLIEANPCDAMAVIFDAKRENFRNEIYPAYKQNRPPAPPELIPQFPLIRRATAAFSIPAVEKEGYEADDIIATYARLAREQGWHVHVISADKDLMQLMRPDVTLYDPMKKKTLTPADVADKFGVSPDKVPDVQALMGDSTDNVPGAAGIGPKTAAALINEFGSLDNLIAKIDTVTPEKRRLKLIAEKDKILISRRLVTLNDQAPVDSDFTAFSTYAADLPRIQDFLKENNFKSLLAKIDKWPALKKTPTPTPDLKTPAASDTLKKSPSSQKIAPVYHLICQEKDLQDFLRRGADKTVVALDTETTGLDPFTAELVGFSLCFEAGEACYVPVRHVNADGATDLFGTRPPAPDQIPVETALNLLRPLLENPNVLKVGHNIKFDLHILNRAYHMPPRIAPIADTMVMSYVLDGTTHSHKMDDLAKILLNYQTIAFSDVCGTGKKRITFDQVPLDKACAYAAEDADITLRLFHELNTRLKADETDRSHDIYETIEAPLLPVLANMEQAGILLDRGHLSRLSLDLNDKIEALTRQIHATAGEVFNINSPAQLGVILFDKMGLTGGKKGANGNWTTDVGVLETLAGEQKSTLAADVLKYRMFSKLKSTYADALLEKTRSDPRVHTWFSQVSTNTGRLSSTDPNLQNIPIRTDEGKEIRRAFIAREGYVLLAADYSQIELRLMAAVADVPALKESFLKNEDIHARTASEIFKKPLSQIDADTRRRAKAINFGIIYGISAFGLANQLNIDRAEAKAYIDAYFAKYPEIKSYMDKTSAFVKQHGYVLTPLGRKCFIQGIQTPATRAFALRSAINAPIQGGAADIIKLAMLKTTHVLKENNLDARLLLQVHDELVFEVAQKDADRAAALIRPAMEGVITLSVPLVADIGIGHDWKQAH